MNRNDFAQSKPLAFKLSQWFMLLVSLIILTYALSSPLQNWDMLGYASTVTSLENTNKSYVHSTTYEQYRLYSTDEEYLELTSGHSYRETMLNDPEAFYQQIPFYKIRILFTLMILGLVKIGMNIFSASHLISAACTCFGILAYYHAFRRHIHPYFWAIIPVFLILFDVQNIARFVTADSLAFLWVGLICYAFLYRKWLAFFSFLTLSVLVRTDLIILVTLFSIYLLIYKANLRGLTIITFLLSCGLYLTVNNYADNYGWSTVFYYALISDMTATHPEVYSSHVITIKEYLHELISNISIFLFDIPTVLFEASILLLFLTQLFTHKEKEDNLILNFFRRLPQQPTLVLTLISIFYVLLHYLAFPLNESRFFVGQYLIAILVLLTTITNLLGKDSVYNAK